MLQQEEIGRSKSKHDGGMTIEAIAQTSEPGTREVLAHGQRLDVADAAAIQVARRRMVDCMRATPDVIRRECQDAENPANPVIRRTMPEKCTMAAVMLN